MIDIKYLVLINNILCYLAVATCFFHALHGGMEKSYLTKLTLFLIGLGFYSSTVTDRTKLLVPGHEYSMCVNIVFSILMISTFVYSYHKAGYLSQWHLWIVSKLNPSKHEDHHNAQAKK